MKLVSEWTTERFSLHNAHNGIQYTVFFENFKVFMLRTIMSNDQLKHLKAAFNQVLREKDPEQVN